MELCLLLAFALATAGTLQANRLTGRDLSVTGAVPMAYSIVAEPRNPRSKSAVAFYRGVRRP
jgi:hypothetical protein